MKKFYQQDNIFNIILTRIFDLLFVNILWIICCIPVITIGASTSALFYVTMKMQENKESRVGSMFWNSFKSNLKQSIPVSLALIAAVAVMVADFHILGMSENSSHSFIYGVCVTLSILLVMFFSWLFPLMSRFENTVRNMFKNAWALAIANIWRSVLLTALNAAPLIWFLVSPETFSAAFLLWFLVGTAVIAFIDSYLLNPVMNKLIIREERGDIDENYEEVYRKWSTDKYFNRETREELLSLDDEAILDRFCKEIEFGTDGLCGIVGAGTNRMNLYTVRKATQGLANYINEQERDKCSVVIAYDSRNMSYEFAKEASLCLNANGIKTYIFPEICPVSALSFAIRHLKCIAGIYITADSMPLEYNGYKVYWEDGALMTSPDDKKIISAIKEVSDFEDVKIISYEDALKSGIYNVLSKEVGEWYIKQVKAQLINTELIRKEAENITIVYTPLNGAGNVPATRILEETGFKKFYVVAEQERPDRNFPTLKSLDIDNENTWELALALAKEKDADIVFATEPSAGRLGVYVKNGKQNYMKLSGNMYGALLADYILRERTSKRTMPKKPAVIKSVLTTRMLLPICKKYNVKAIDVPKGFRYIGEYITRITQEKTYDFVFGMSEDGECLTGTYSREKDACVTMLLLSEMAAYYKSKKMTLSDALYSLYEEYGYYKEDVEKISFKGMSGAAKMQTVIEEYRNNPPEEIGGYRVLYMRDYKTGMKISLADGGRKKMKFPKSDVICFELDKDAWCCVVPSKSEGEINYYIGVREKTEKEAEEQSDKIKKDISGGR